LDLIEACNEAGGLTGTCNGKNYALIHATACWIYPGATSSAPFSSSS
jgi:predicted HAD superfamily phosphohydrolase